jgi:thioredoxin 1
VTSGIVINIDNFGEEVLRSPIPVLIDFWATWCGPCKMISPFIDQLAEEYWGRLKVCKVNVDEQNELSMQHSITSIPMLILYKDGVIVSKRAGAIPKHDIEAMFKGFMQSGNSA